MFSERPPRRLRNRGPERLSAGSTLAAEAGVSATRAPVARREEHPPARDEPRLVMWMLPVMFAIAGTAAYLYWPWESDAAPREWRSPDGRQWGGGGGFFGARIAQGMEDYFALPAAQRPQYLDQQIDQQEGHMADLRQRAKENGMAPEDAIAQWTHRRSDRIGELLASVPGTDRPRFDEYLGALAARRKQRGLEPYYDPAIVAVSERQTRTAMAAAATQPAAGDQRAQ